jgi:spermidine/putrescine transport system permease protein
VSAPGSTVAVSRNGRRLLTAWFVFFLIFLYLPSVILLIFSFNSGTVPVFPLQSFTTRWYSEAWHDQQLRDAFVRSIKVGLGTSIVATVIGILAAYPLARRRFRARNAITAFSLVPLVVPPIVVAVALLMLFRKGPHPIPLSLWTVLAGHVVISLPYCILLLVPRIASIDVRLEEAAHDLGASSVLTFRRIILPLITPAIFSAFLIAFVVSIDDYAIASFLAANSETYPVYLFGQIRQAEHLPPMIPVATVMLAVSFCIVILAEVVRRRGDRRVGFAP